MPHSYDQRLEGLRTLLARAGVEPGQVTVGGSGALGALGLRAPRDLDVHVPDEEAWKAMLAAEGGQQSVAPSGSPRVQFDTPTGEMEFFTGPWNVGGQEFGENAPQIMHGSVPHWTAQHTLNWKKAMGRPKDQPDIALLEQHLQPKTAAELPSQEDIYQQVREQLPEDVRAQMQHASGGLPDARGVSDVDIAYFTKRPHELLQWMPEGTTREERDPKHSIYSVPGYDRPVNFYATMDAAHAVRAPSHRATQLALAREYPQLAEQAHTLKTEGLGTEKAWAQLLGVEGDVYEEMMNRQKMLELAKNLGEKTAKAHKLSRRTYFRGLHISIETDKGELRHWKDPHNGESGSTKMKYPYGYIRRTKGVDGDHVDVYVGPNKRAKNVYIIHQMKAPEFKKYDEDKCMLGFLSAQAAKVAYLGHYNDRRFFGTMTVMPFEDFEKKVLHSFELKKPHKIAATPMQMVSRTFRLWPSLPDILTGDTTGDTALEQLVSPEEEPPTIEPDVVLPVETEPVVEPEQVVPPGARKPAPDTVPESKKEGFMDKEAVGTRIMPWQKLTRKMVEAATKKAPEVGKKRISPLAGLSAKDVQEAAGRTVTGSAMLKAAYVLGVSLAHEHHTKLAAGEGEIIRTIRRALQKGLTSEAESLAQRSVQEGRISEEMLGRLGQTGEGVLPAEAKLWEAAGKAPGEAAAGGAEKATWQHTPEEMRAFAGGKTTPPKAPVSAEGGGGAMREVEEVLGAKPQGSSWQHTPEEMRAYARGGEAAVPAAAPTATSAAAPAAAEAGASEGGGMMLPILGGAGLGAGGVLAGQALAGNKSPSLPYYKGAADAQITGLRGGLLKTKTMNLKLPKLPRVSALPKTPKLQNVLAKLSEADPITLTPGAGIPGVADASMSVEYSPEFQAKMDEALMRFINRLAAEQAGGAPKQAQSLGDPAFWQGGEQAAAAPPQATSAEEVVTQLPLGTFQGMNTKISPEGERSTSVKVTPDALGSPEMLAAIFQVEPGAKVELETPEQPTADVSGPIEGGAGGPPMPEGMPQDAAAAPPPPEPMA